MSDSGILKFLPLFGEFSAVYTARFNQALQAFDAIYKNIYIPALVHNAVMNSMSPQFFEQQFASIKDDNPAAELRSQNPR